MEASTTTLSSLTSLYFCLLTLTLFLLFRTFYRLYLHPLSPYPGPRLAASTHLYEFYHDVLRGGQYQFLILQWHRIYGPVIRISPHELHVSDPDFYDALYKGGVREKWAWKADMTNTPTSFFSAVTEEEHRRKRAPLNSFFSKRSVVSLEENVARHVESLCQRFEEFKETGEVLNLKYAYAALTLDVVSEYAFSKSYGALQDADFAPRWLDAVENIITGCHLNAFFPWMKKLPVWLAGRLNPHVGTVMEYQGVLREQIQGVMRGEKDGEGRTIFHELLQSEVLRREERDLVHLSEEAQNIVGAGQITTASHLAATTFFVLENAMVLRKLKEELKEVMPDQEQMVGLMELERLEYLSAVINEGHRLSPGVIHRLARISPTEPITYHCYAFPRGTPISTSALCLHLNPDIFPNPYTFNPDRWLGPDRQSLKRYLVPYGKGTRSCIGQNLAQAEIYMTLAAVFRRFDLKLFETSRGRDIDAKRDCITGLPERRSKGVRVVVR